MSRSSTVSDEIARILAAANASPPLEKTASLAPTVAPRQERPADWAMKLAAELREADTVTVADVDALLLKQAARPDRWAAEMAGSAVSKPGKWVDGIKKWTGGLADSYREGRGAAAAAKAAPTPKKPRVGGVYTGVGKAPVKLKVDKSQLIGRSKDHAKIDEAFNAVKKQKKKVAPKPKPEGLTGGQMAGIAGIGAGAGVTGAIGGSLYEKNKPWHERIF